MDGITSSHWIEAQEGYWFVSLNQLATPGLLFTAQAQLSTQLKFIEKR